MCSLKASWATSFPSPTHPPKNTFLMFPLQLIILIFHFLKYYFNKHHLFRVKKIDFCFCSEYNAEWFLFPLEDRRMKKRFLLSCQQLSPFICLVQWGFCFSAKEPCYFSKAFVYNIPSCASAHPAHFAGVNVKKTKGCWVWGYFMMFLFSLQIFHEQGLYPIAKE